MQGQPKRNKVTHDSKSCDYASNYELMSSFMTVISKLSSDIRIEARLSAYPGMAVICMMVPTMTQEAPVKRRVNHKEATGEQTTNQS